MEKTNIYAILKLDPFYQQFLRAHFNCKSLVFKFPKNHDLLVFLQHYLSKAPRNYVGQDYGDDTFRIEIPYMEHKNPETYCYLSEQAKTFMRERIRNYYQAIYRWRITKQEKIGLSRKEIIYIFFEEYNIDQKFYDRVERDYKRFKRREYNRIYYEMNIKKKLKKTCELSAVIQH